LALYERENIYSSLFNIYGDKYSCEEYDLLIWNGLSHTPHFLDSNVNVEGYTEMDVKEINDSLKMRCNDRCD